MMEGEKKLFEKIAYIWKKLGQSIYNGERLERNLKGSAALGAVITFIGAVMTVMNIVQHKGFVTYTTGLIFVTGIVVFVAAKILRNRSVIIITLMIMGAIIFSYYAIYGVNEGFAILWTLLVPLAFCYFGSVKYGIILSGYYELLFIVLFYSPIRSFEARFYNETFMNRYPVLYFCGVLMNSIAMIQYHIATLRQAEFEEQLKEAANKAIAADKAKSLFLAQMSHEIRTPINAVLGMNEMILRESEDDDIIEYASNIHSAGNTLLTLINSILDFSKIEDGKMELVSVKYDVASLINDLVVSITPRVRAKGLTFNVQVDESMPAALYGDDVRVSQVIMNILTNAVKYTEEGSVTFSISKSQINGDEAEILVSVKDTGIGIRKEDMEKLTVSFERLDTTRNRHIEGTGLGMSIVTKLLQMMGSSLQVESEYGNGSTFSFLLRQKIGDPQPIGNYAKRVAESTEKKSQKELIQAPSARILVVDDNEMNLKVARGLLKLCAIKPDLAISGPEAIEKMREKEYDIVLLDHMMPKMDGIETLKRLKEQDLVPDHTVIIALTANAIIGAKEMYIGEGFDDYLPKPIEINELCAKLGEYLPKEAFESNVESVDNKNNKQKKSETSNNAGQSLQSKQEEEILNFEPADQESDILNFEPADQEGEVLNFEPAEVSEDVLSFEPEDEEEQGTAKHYDTRKLKEKGFDTGAAMAYFAGDEDFYSEMLAEYVKEFNDREPKLSGFLNDCDWKEYQILVHSLKSASKSIGAAELYEKALALENAAKEEDGGFIKENHPGTMELYRKVVETISECEKH